MDGENLKKNLFLSYLLFKKAGFCMKKEILKNPYESGKNMSSNYSICANPFRNYEGYSKEHDLWNKGWNDAKKEAANE
jgi:hypothetical protein